MSAHRKRPIGHTHPQKGYVTNLATKIGENDTVSAAGQSRELWETMGARWAEHRDILWDGTRPVSEWLVAHLDAQPGETILELAAGTGDTGFLIAASLGSQVRLLTSDRSESMLAGARARAAELGLAGVEFRALDAEALELADGSRDAVLSRFGYLLKGNRPLAEVRRVLRPGGRLAFAVWAERSRNAWMTVPRQALAAAGDVDEGRSGDLLAGRSLDAVSAAVCAAGFSVEAIDEIRVAYRFPDEPALWAFAAELRGPVALAIEELDDERRAVVRAELERRAEPDGLGGYILGGVAIVVLAR